MDVLLVGVAVAIVTAIAVTGFLYWFWEIERVDDDEPIAAYAPPPVAPPRPTVSAPMPVQPPEPAPEPADDEMADDDADDHADEEARAMPTEAMPPPPVRPAQETDGATTGGAAPLSGTLIPARSTELVSWEPNRQVAAAVGVASGLGALVMWLIMRARQHPPAGRRSGGRRR